MAFRDGRTAESLDQAFVAGEIKEPIGFQRTAADAAELIAAELGLARDVEVIWRVERIVAVELEHAAVEGVAARSGQDRDLATVIVPVLGAVGVRLNPE